MRQIGTIPPTTDPKVFGDYLLTLGVTSKAVGSKDGWSIWVHNEDHLARARAELAAYLADPADPRFREAEKAAREVIRERDRLDRLYRKNVRDLSGTWDRLDVRGRPLTMFLVAVCVAVFLAEQVSPLARFWTLDRLAFFSLSAMTRTFTMASGLEDIHRGEVWRLITPIFLHGGVVHIIFNMWAMMVEGTLIENRRGTKIMAVLVLLSAVTSNICQYLYVLNFYQHLVPWVGISGVGYALFGYIWMKGRLVPEQGMVMHPSSVRVMLLWLLLGFTGLFPMANGAHVGGLIVGVLFGLARF